LVDLRYKKHLSAKKGRPGEGGGRTGSDGDDLIIRVPVGTQVFNLEGDLLFDLLEDQVDVVVAQGGRGGKGNLHFTTPSRRAPDFAQPGEEGQELDLHLSLKVLADVSLIGFPNAGKSTLIRTVSRAKPRVADFPFTTIKPHLGVVSVDEDRSYVMADMPGLIKGASEGVGLGLRFLKHIERTKAFVFLLTLDYDPDRSIASDFEALREELGNYDETLLQRPFVIGLSQIDRLDVADQVEEIKEQLAPYGQVYPFSSFSKEGLKDLLKAITYLLETNNHWRT
jgi:GTP-binding protein